METDIARARPRGRPREFDLDVALSALCLLFWNKGYEATSLLDMVASTGRSKSSLRAAFGNKQQIFAATLSHYLQHHFEPYVAICQHGNAGIEDIEATFSRQLSSLTGQQSSLGCMATNIAAELGTDNPTCVKLHSQIRSQLELAFTAALKRAVTTGEMAPCDIDSRCSVLATLFIGIALIDKAGASDTELSSRYHATLELLSSWRIQPQPLPVNGA